MIKYQVISEEKDSRGKVLFEGNLCECYEFQRKYRGLKYPSISSATQSIL